MRGTGAIVPLFWALFWALSCAGCSLGFVAGPPAEHPRVTSFTCSDSVIAPVLDSVVGGSLGLVVVSAAGMTDAEWAENNPDLTRTEAVALYAPLAALAAVSAYYGYRTVHDCREARAQAAARVDARMQALPASWPPPAAPAPRQPSQ